MTILTLKSHSKHGGQGEVLMGHISLVTTVILQLVKVNSCNSIQTPMSKDGNRLKSFYGSTDNLSLSNID